MRVRAICVDAKNKPKEIPQDKWVIENNLYHITWMYNQCNQKGIKGVTLAEHDISMYAPYNCYRLTRFAIFEEDLPTLREMMKTSSELSDVDINELIEQLETVET